jgi:outer membrane lipopolysaccharide assembly protein LptE/RlpB
VKEWRVASGEQKRSATAIALLSVATSLAIVLAGCGYHIAGRSSALPKEVHVIAIPAFENKTTSYRLEQRLTAATVHEFLTATSYRVVPNSEDGDAVLKGTVVSLQAYPLLFDTTSGRATTMVVTIKCEVSLVERATQKVLYHTDNFVFRNEYEISTDVNDPTSLRNFFEEQDTALARMSRDFAVRLVAAVTENY